VGIGTGMGWDGRRK